MSDYFSELLAGDGPVARTIKRGNKSQTVFIRRVTAGERLHLAGNQTLKFGGDGSRGEMEMSLADMARNRHMMVQFCTVTESGDQVFKSLGEVQAQPDWLVAAIHDHAVEANRDDDPGKS